MGQAIPVLKIEDEVLARQFYVDALGFKVDWDWRQKPDLPIYMGLSRDGWVIHLTEHVEDCEPAGAVYFIADNIAEFYQELKRKNPEMDNELIEQPWGQTELLLMDPFQNKLRFASPTKKLTEK
jgi:uncharacterized glyoxalase superfamily protein PhnB